MLLEVQECEPQYREFFPSSKRASLRWHSESWLSIWWGKRGHSCYIDKKLCLPKRPPIKKRDWASPFLYLSPQMRSHWDTVEKPLPPTHSHKLRSMSQSDVVGVHTWETSWRPRIDSRNGAPVVSNRHTLLAKILRTLKPREFQITCSLSPKDCELSVETYVSRRTQEQNRSVCGQSLPEPMLELNDEERALKAEGATHCQEGSRSAKIIMRLWRPWMVQAKLTRMKCNSWAHPNSPTHFSSMSSTDSFSSASLAAPGPPSIRICDNWPSGEGMLLPWFVSSGCTPSSRPASESITRFLRLDLSALVLSRNTIMRCNFQ